MSMKSDLARAKVPAKTAVETGVAEIGKKEEIVSHTHDFVLNHMQFPNHRKPHGHVVQIKTERTKNTNQQVGPVVLHTIFDAGFVRHVMKVVGSSNDQPYGFRPDYKRALIAIENAMKKLHLFGKDAKYQKIDHPGSFYDSSPPLTRPATPREYDGIAVYSDGLMYHFDDCKFASNRSIPRENKFDHCPACNQTKMINYLRGMGVLLHTPPLRFAKEFGSATIDRLNEIREVSDSFNTPEIIEKLEKLLAAGDGEALMRDLPLALEEIKNRQYYARRHMDDVFGKMDYERNRLDQKGVDTFISSYIARVGTFAEKCGGRHIIGLVAGDGDYQIPVWEAILNSSWKSSSPNKHGDPRVKIVVFSYEGMSSKLLTGEYLLQNKYGQGGVDPLDKWRHDLILSGLTNFPITKEFAEELRILPREEFGGQNQERERQEKAVNQ